MKALGTEHLIPSHASRPQCLRLKPSVTKDSQNIHICKTVGKLGFLSAQNFSAFKCREFEWFKISSVKLQSNPFISVWISILFARLDSSWATYSVYAQIL